MKFCLPFCLGIIAGWRWNPPPGPVILLLGAATLAALLARIIRRDNPVFPPLLLCAVFLLGIGKIGCDAGRTEPDDIARLLPADTSVILEATLSDDALISGRSVRCLADAERCGTDGRMFGVSGVVQISMRSDRCDRETVAAMTVGQRLRLRGILSAPPRARNPGEFDMELYFRLNGISARFFADSAGPESLCGRRDPDPIDRCVIPVRSACSRALDSLIGGEEANFLSGLLLGERRSIPLEIKNEFINAGVMHILAVSGLHVAIVAMILLILFQLLRLPEKATLLLTILALCYYNFFTGNTASVTRSVIMGSVVLGGRMMERRSDIYNALAVSAAVILLIDARQFFQAGFQLSFAAVFSLVYLYPKVYGLRSLLPAGIRKHRIVEWFCAAAAVSVAAGLGTLPFTAFYFGKIPVIGFLANLVAVPLSNVILAVGMLTLAIWFAAPVPGVIYAAATRGLTTLFLHVVAFFGDLPFAYIAGRFSITASIGYYAVLALLINLRKPLFRKYILQVLLLLATGIVWWHIFRPSAGYLTVTCIDIGQGDAILLELPDGKKMLVDTGPVTPSVDAGSRFIAPLLRWKNIGTLDAIVLTHPHSDHIGGVPSLLRTICVKKLYDSALPEQTDLHKEYLRLIDSLGLPHEHLFRGMQIGMSEQVRIYVLHPDSSALIIEPGTHINLNNTSVVLKVVYGSSSIFLVGDIEHGVELNLVNRYGDWLKCDVLKAGHHGSNTSSSPEFLTSVDPGDVVISVGTRNKFHHPSPDVLRRYEVAGYRYYRTDQLGAVVFRTDGSRWEHVEWRNE